VTQGAIPLDLLTTQLEHAKQALKIIDSLPNKVYFKHPYFGHLNKPKSIRFLAIHTRHHLKIMAKIVK